MPVPTAQPLDHGAYEKALVDWVVLSTGVPRENVRFEDQKANQPLGQYCTMRIDTIYTYSSVDEERRKVVGADVQVEYTGPRKLMVYVSFYDISDMPSTDATAYAAAAQSSLQTIAVRDALNDGGMVSIDTGNVFTKSVDKSGTWENVARFDVSFRVISSLKETVTTIEHVVLDAPDLGIADETIDL